jgi:hypothetical protein
MQAGRRAGLAGWVHSVRAGLPSRATALPARLSAECCAGRPASVQLSIVVGDATVGEVVSSGVQWRSRQGLWSVEQLAVFGHRKIKSSLNVKSTSLTKDPCYADMLCFNFSFQYHPPSSYGLLHTRTIAHSRAMCALTGYRPSEHGAAACNRST